MQKLKDAGIKVELIELPEAKELNKVFIKNITTSLPYTHLKVATTQDGKLTAKKGTRTKLTTKEEDVKVHRLRAKYDGILVGKNTVLIDNPRLTCRLSDLTDEKEHGTNPIRIILDSQGELLEERYQDLKIFKEENATIIATTKEDTSPLPSGISMLICKKNQNNQVEIKDLLKKLYQKGIYSLLIEGGYQIIESFTQADAIDETTILTSEVISQDTSLPTIKT